MAGCSIEEAHNAHKVAKQSQPHLSGQNSVVSSVTSSAKVASTKLLTMSTAPSTAASTHSIVVEGIMYIHAADQPPPIPSSTAYTVRVTDSTTLITVPSTHWEPPSPGSIDSSSSSYLALSGPLKASVDWHTLSCSIADLNPEDSEVSPIPSCTAHVLLAKARDMPFLLDSGASIHISPEQSDFKCLHLIMVHPIKGFNRSSTTAIGMGDIDLCTGAGCKLCLRDVLFVPTCMTHLLSVSSLAITGYNFITFGPANCWISDKFNKIIVRGFLDKSTKLYPLNCDSAHVMRSMALLARCTPNLVTWH